MNSEQYLKEISNLLKKHEQFFNDNPEFFSVVENRLLKAIGDEDEDEGDYEYESDLFDELPDEDEEYEPEGEEEIDEADSWLKENDPDAIEQDTEQEDIAPQKQQEEDEKPDETLDDAQVEESPKKKSSRYRDWQPKDKYEPHHEDAIKEHMKQGYSHREAERLAGAHEAPGDFYSALKHTVNPSEPSEKMLEHMREISKDWLTQADRKQMETADPSMNPIKHATGKAIAAHEEAHGDFADAYNEFLQSDQVKGLRGRDRHKAIRNWKQQWNEENPDYKEKAATAASAGAAHKEAGEARARRREEGTKAILEAGMSGGQQEPEGFSSEAAGQTAGQTTQQAAQLVGGQKGESGYVTSTKRDPAAVFAERNPEYVKHLRQKAEAKLNPEQQQRMAAVDSFKKKGE